MLTDNLWYVILINVLEVITMNRRNHMRTLESKQDLRDLVQDLGEALGVPYILLNNGVLTIPTKEESLLAQIKVGGYANFETFGFYNLNRDEQLQVRNILHDVVVATALKELTITVNYITDCGDEEEPTNRVLNSSKVKDALTSLWKATKKSTLEYVVVNEEIISYKLKLPQGVQIILDYSADEHIWITVGRQEGGTLKTQFRTECSLVITPTALAEDVREIVIGQISTR